MNTEDLELCPSISRDGKYPFFTSNRPNAFEITETTCIRRELRVVPRSDRPHIDIYSMDAGCIGDFRNRRFRPMVSRISGVLNTVAAPPLSWSSDR